jgi:hypothetical protein
LLSAPESSTTNPFVPLRLLPDEEVNSIADAKSETAEPDQKQCVEIVLLGGVIIRVHEASNLHLVSKIVSTLRGQE